MEKKEEEEEDQPHVFLLGMGVGNVIKCFVIENKQKTNPQKFKTSKNKYFIKLMNNPKDLYLRWKLNKNLSDWFIRGV